MRSFFAVFAVLLLAGCTLPGDGAEGGGQEAPAPMDPGAGSGATPATAWPEGILWVAPMEEQLVGDVWRGPEVILGGFDIQAGVLGYAVDEEILLQWPDGRFESIRLDGITAMGRLSFSPDASMAVVQGIDPTRQTGPMENIDIFVIDIEAASWTRISDRPVNDESPEWSPDGRHIAYTTFDPDAGIDLRIVEPDGTPVRTIPDAGGIHLAWSPDSSRILEPGRMRIYDAASGVQVADLRQAAIDGLLAAGYTVDTRYEGQAGRGTFPLDGDWSPDGARIVFDGAVAGAQSAIIIATIGTDGEGFQQVAGPLPATPEAVNFFNFSPANPMWR